MSATILTTAITSSIGFLINVVVLFLVLSRGRQKYHYLFAGFLFVCALWDLGIILAMLRNSHVNELPIYGYIILWPCVFIPTLIYHFTREYLDQPMKKTIIALWVVSTVIVILGISGLAGKIEGVYNYNWGNIFKPDSMLRITFLVSLPIWFFFIWSSCLSLFRARQRETSHVKKRHLTYILASFSVISLSIVKTITLYNVDNPFLLPTGMLLNDICSGLIGIAIIKYSLLDITIIIRRTTIYSILVALIILVFSVSEHLLVTYVGDFFGEGSFYIHVISIAVVIAAVMPVKKRVERGIERFFARKRIEF
ncbi:MAG TPA: hypothetical protein G4O19_03095 [Dehalococcoidia bacterium]|nr:hypothetical protein [Dehalococcoidia bacterium]